MKTVKASLLDTKCSEEVKLSLAVAIKDLDNKINRFSQELLQYQRIESTWRTDYWRTLKLGVLYNPNQLRNLCTLANVKITESVYQSKRNPKWQISKGSGPSQLRSPVGLAIQDSSNNIYVCDRGGMRIQVFSSEGEHILLLDQFNSGPLKVFSVDSRFLHAYNSVQNAIYKFLVNSIDKYQIKYSCNLSPLKSGMHRSRVSPLESSRSLLKSVIPTDHSGYYSIIRSDNVHTISELCAPSSLTQATGWSTLGSQQPIVPLQSQLTASKNITLTKAMSKSLTFTPVDIAYYEESIFLLSSQDGDLIHEFNLNCNSIRSFFPCNTMKRPLAMCIDREGRIIVVGDNVETDGVISGPVSVPRSYSNLRSGLYIKTPINQSEMTKLFVISQEGDVIIHEMDISCKNCIGVAVNSKFDIFLLNENDSYVLSSL